MNHFRGQFSANDSVAPELIRHAVPDFNAATAQDPLDKPLGGPAVSAGLQKHVNHFTVLVDRTPERALFAVDFHEDFVDIEGVPIPPDVLASIVWRSVGRT